MQKMIIAFCFQEKRQFFRRKLGKIAENCDHNIDPKFFRLENTKTIFLHSVKKKREKPIKNKNLQGRKTNKFFFSENWAFFFILEYVQVPW
jgi:hypothetical protein